MFHITKHNAHKNYLVPTYFFIKSDMRNFIKGYSRWCTKTLVEANATITKNKKIGGQVQDAMRCISCVTSVMMSYYSIILTMSIDSVKRKVIISTTGKRNCLGGELPNQTEYIDKRQQKYKYVTSPVQLVIIWMHLMPYILANSYLLQPSRT